MEVKKCKTQWSQCSMNQSLLVDRPGIYVTPQPPKTDFGQCRKKFSPS